MTLGSLGPLPEIQYTPYTKGDIVVHKREVYTITHIEEDTFVTLTSAVVLLKPSPLPFQHYESHLSSLAHSLLCCPLYDDSRRERC